MEVRMTIHRLQRRIGHNSSQVTKNLRMFVDPHADGRSMWARRWNDLVLMHANDLGGFDMLSEAQLSICKRAAALECQLESLEGKMSTGEAIDVDQYARLARTLARLFELIGIKRLARPIAPEDELARALNGYAGGPVDDDESDEPAPIEEGLDREPGEA
jgi:hypothetical protein